MEQNVNKNIGHYKEKMKLMHNFDPKQFEQMKYADCQIVTTVGGGVNRLFTATYGVVFLHFFLLL